VEKSLTELEIGPSSFTMKHKFVSSVLVEESLAEETSFSSQEIYALFPLPFSPFLLANFSLI